MVAQPRCAIEQREVQQVVEEGGVVGEAAATQIAKHFASEKLYIARCADALRLIRNAAICDEFDAISSEHGSPTAVVQLALKYRLSDRQIE